jgi:hypothetical protein
MALNILESEENQPRRLRAIIEIDNRGELRIFPLCDNDLDEQKILDALRIMRQGAD